MARLVLPGRIAWAIETMAVLPGDRLLEIGAGRGVAVASISERLTGGTITGIDRSEKAIGAARQRNADGIASGTVVLHSMPLDEADFPDGSFDKVFAINVNLFWVNDPADELVLIRRLLIPDGTLFVFYEPPSAAQAPKLARTVAAALEAGGFTASIRTATREGKTLLCVFGRMRQTWANGPSRTR